ncbi:transcriptional regulator PpsR [Methylobacterium sp. Leaf456]|uniref:transcriptional regulator PpsR n=1 Tax=Methylobacterium sp. Leaf456 TaxID=1736382 RepID=UPI0006F79C06|nr:transcriptional regulator PpsR [Methylobacterium sp. Leaf456]KQT45600.1 transcriptional regulator PpsR [Methylobacterium sp. Leaf456]
MVILSSLASHPPQRPSPALQQAAGLLDSEAAGLLLAATSDISLIVGDDGVIQETASGALDLESEDFASWRGRLWVDTVTVESRPKIDALLRDAAAGTMTRWRQVNHPSRNGPDVPIRYAGLRPRQGGPIIVVGQDLRTLAGLQRRLADTQQALERDYDRLRSAETRYKLLFQLSGEPVLVADAGTRRVTEANPAAARLLGRPQKRILGQDAADLFEASATRDIAVLFAGLRISGQAADLVARLGGGRGEARLSASLFRGEGSTSILLRLSPLASAQAGPSTDGGALDVIRRMPEAFVVTDPGRHILTANTAFLDLVQLATEEQVRGQTLDRWLGREETEALALFATLREHGSVRHFSTVMRGAYGSVEEVEVAAVSAPAAEQPCLGFTIRATPRRAAPVHTAGHDLPRSVEQMTELVGRVSMKALVRETTDLIEKLCIEAALRITRDNRASAAEMLGLSRQGLYAKMRRYGIGDLDAGDVELGPDREQ